MGGLDRPILVDAECWKLVARSYFFLETASTEMMSLVASTW